MDHEGSMSEVHAISIRMPADISNWLKKQAAKNDRSINKEIVRVLREVKDSARMPTTEAHPG